jgi:hypothetical protein
MKSAETIAWPVKRQEIKTAVFDSTRWNGFPFREGDVVVATWGKTGTTWVEQIVTQLLMDAPEGLRVDCGPWVDLRLQPLDEMLGELECMVHRRCLKTHLPLDALVFSPLAKYIYIGRDARDVVWSAYSHQASFTQAALDAFNNTPGRVGPPVMHPQFGVREYYLEFLETGEMPGFGMAPSGPTCVVGGEPGICRTSCSFTSTICRGIWRQRRGAWPSFSAWDWNRTGGLSCLNTAASTTCAQQPRQPISRCGIAGAAIGTSASC